MHDAAHSRQHQAKGMIGHAVVVGASTIEQANATRTGMGQINVFIACTQRPDQTQARHGIHLRSAQANRTNGQHHLHLRAMLGNGLCTLLGIGGVQHLKVLGQLVTVCFREHMQNKENRLQGRHGRKGRSRSKRLF